MEKVKSIDASEAYGVGKTIDIMRDPRFGQYHAQWPTGGQLPEELEGQWSAVGILESKINIYLSQRKEHFDQVERRAEVRKGKAAHAAKQEAEAA